MPEVISATRSMIPDIAAFMSVHFNQSRRLFSDILGLRWSFDFDEIGKLLVDGSKIGGFFGLHHSLRRIRGQEHRFSAMHGVVVAPEYRGSGTSMLTNESVNDPDANYVAWTANPAMNARYIRAGFKIQNECARLVFPGATIPTLIHAPAIRRLDHATFDSLIDPDSRRVFEDHRGSRFAEHLFSVRGAPLGVISRRAYHQRRLPISELAYTNDYGLLRQVFEPIRLDIHRRERTVAMRINPAETSFAPLLSWGIPGSYLYKSQTLGPGDFNILYGELTVLG